MPRGERIGEAYIRIHADGSRIDREIRDDFERLDPVLRSLGNDQSDEYRQGWKEGLRDHPILDPDDITDGISRAVGRADARSKRITKRFLDRIREDLAGQFGDDVGGQMFKSLEESLQRGRLSPAVIKDLFPGEKELEQRLNAFEKSLVKAQRRILARQTITDKEKQALLRQEGLTEAQIRRQIIRAREELEEEYRQRAIRGEEFLIKLRAQALDELQRMEREHDRIIERMQREQARRLEQIEKERTRELERQQQQRERIAREAARSAQNRAAEAEAAARRAEKAEREHIKRLRDAQGEYQELATFLKAYAEGVRGAGRDHDSLANRLRALREEMDDLGLSTSDTNRELRNWDRTLQTAVPRIRRTRTSLLRFSDLMGRAFGRGARNDFINFIGAAVRGVARLATQITTGLLEVLFNLARGFGMVVRGLRQTAEGLADVARHAGTEGLKQGLGQIGNGLLFIGTTAATAGLNLAVLAAAATVFVGVAGVLAALINGLAAALTALVSPLVFAAATGIPALTAVVVPLGAAVGVAVAAFQSLSEAEKEALKNDLKPLTNALKDLGDAAAEVLFRDVGKWARELAPVLRRVRPGVIGVAEAIRDGIGRAIEDATSSDRFAQFIRRLNRFLPNATAKLGEAIQNTLEGLGGFFIAMIPAMNRFLNWLIDVTQRFSDWANSARGRNEIREFFENASSSARKVGDFLREVLDLVSLLISRSRSTGEGLFATMADNIGRFVDYLRDNPDVLQDWLEWGDELARKIGDLVVAIGEMIGALDTPTTRAILTGLLTTFEKIFNFISKYPQVLLVAFGPLGTVAAAVKTIYDLVVKIGDGFSNWSTVLAGFPGLGIFKGLSDLSNLFGGSSKPFLGELVPRLQDTVDKGLQTITTMKNLRASLDDVTGAATNATFALARQQLQSSGLLAAGQQLGFTTRTLIRAFAGERDAIAAIQPTAERLKSLTGEQRLAYGLLLEQLGQNTAALRRERREIARNAAETANYAGKLRGVPKKVQSLIEATGIKPTISGIAKVVEQARQLAPNLKRGQIKTIIEASGVEATRKNIEKVLKKADELKAKREARIDADIKGFEARERRVRQMLTTLENRPPTKPKVDLNTEPARNAMNALIADLSSRRVPPLYVDIIRRYKTVGNPGRTGGGGSERTASDEAQRVGGVTSGRVITVPEITVVEAADGRATAQEILNRLAGLAY